MSCFYESTFVVLVAKHRHCLVHLHHGRVGPREMSGRGQAHRVPQRCPGKHPNTTTTAQFFLSLLFSFYLRPKLFYITVISIGQYHSCKKLHVIETPMDEYWTHCCVTKMAGNNNLNNSWTSFFPLYWLLYQKVYFQKSCLASFLSFFFMLFNQVI